MAWITPPDFTDGQLVTEVQLDILSNDLNELYNNRPRVAKYSKTASQPSLANATTNAVTWQTNPIADASISLNTTGASNTFTINRAGIWLIEASLRVVLNGSTTPEAFCTIDATPGVNTQRYGATSWRANGGGQTASVPLVTTRRFVVGDSIVFNVTGNSGGTYELQATIGEQVHASFLWLSP